MIGSAIQMLWFFVADSVTLALTTISVIATDKHTRITYAIAMAKKHIIDMIMRCGMQKTTIKTKIIKTLQVKTYLLKMFH